MTKEFDIVFIGSGPAGFAGAIRAAQLGAKVAIIEIGFIGGVCLNRGCIPSKSLLHSTQAFLDAKNSNKYGVSIDNINIDIAKIIELKKTTIEKIRAGLERTIQANNIEIISGLASLDENGKLSVSKAGNTEEIQYKNLIIATGSKPRELPNIPKQYALTSDTILSLDNLPERTLIIGSGAIGIEWARILNALGKNVCVLELADRLAPIMDESVSTTIERIFKKQKIEFHTNTSIKDFVENKAIFSNDKSYEFDKILVAVGRSANLTGLDKINLDKERGFIKVDENFKTNFENIYAVGDITGIQMLAHTAQTQSIQLIEHLILGKEININYKNIPSVIYGKPEIACVGYSEQALKSENLDYKVSKIPLTISAKAFIDGELDGMVKVMSVNEKIVGAAIVANDASSLLQQLTIAIDLGTTINDFSKIVFAHPTTSEAIAEAVLNLDNKALFVPPKR